jgi:hypothetical protein
MKDLSHLATHPLRVADDDSRCLLCMRNQNEKGREHYC